MSQSISIGGIYLLNLPWEDLFLTQSYNSKQVEFILKLNVFEIYNNWTLYTEIEKKENMNLLFLWGEYLEDILIKRASFMSYNNLDVEYKRIKDIEGKRTKLKFVNICSCHGALEKNISNESNLSALEHARYFATRMIKGYNLRKEIMKSFNFISI